MPYRNLAASVGIETDVEALLAEAPGAIAELLEQNREQRELADLQEGPLRDACRALLEAHPR